jgi:hypothetical protein
MPATDFRDGCLAPETFQNNPDLFLGSEFAPCGFSDLFDNNGGHGGSSLHWAMTSFGRTDGDCQAQVLGEGGSPPPLCVAKIS